MTQAAWKPRPEPATSESEPGQRLHPRCGSQGVPWATNGPGKPVCSVGARLARVLNLKIETGGPCLAEDRPGAQSRVNSAAMTACLKAWRLAYGLATDARE